jgi:hypothetical protein
VITVINAKSPAVAVARQIEKSEANHKYNRAKAVKASRNGALMAEIYLYQLIIVFLVAVIVTEGVW